MKYPWDSFPEKTSVWRDCIKEHFELQEENKALKGAFEVSNNDLTVAIEENLKLKESRDELLEAFKKYIRQIGSDDGFIDPSYIEIIQKAEALKGGTK